MLMKRIMLLMAVSLVVAAMIVAMAMPAFAQGNSTPGQDRFENNEGKQQATEVGAQCDTGAGSGAFGFFGKGNDLSGFGEDNSQLHGAIGRGTGEFNADNCA